MIFSSGDLSSKNFRLRLIFGVCTLVASVLGLSAPAQTASLNAAGQVGPGTTASISSAQGVGQAAGSASKQKLDGALSPATRQTLQEAMNTVSPAALPQKVALGPGDAAEVDQTGVNAIAFAQLPNQVKAALNGGIHHSLSDSGR